MEGISFFDTLDLIITVTDVEGTILYMNHKAQSVFGNIAGNNLMDCHNAKSQEIIRRLISQNQTNTYTIQKGMVKKLIHQAPWYSDGQVAGLVEFSIVIPNEMPHHIRG